MQAHTHGPGSVLTWEQSAHRSFRVTDYFTIGTQDELDFCLDGSVVCHTLHEAVVASSVWAPLLRA